MRVKTIMAEDFVNYKKPSMFISTCTCDFKCCREQGLDVSICQNSELVNQPTIEIPNEYIYERYVSNNITSAVVIGGLEPFKQTEEIYGLIECFRKRACYDDFVIYTGYTIEEIPGKVLHLRDAAKVGLIVKFGRFIPNHEPHHDEVLGVKLASDNQRGVRMC